MIKFDCPSCGKSIRVKDKWAGRKGKCPGCGETIQIPNAASEQNPRAEPAKSQDDVSDRWFLKTEDGDDYGPVEKAELDQWLKEGLVTHNCHIWQEGEPRWQRASDIYPELETKDEKEKPSASKPPPIPHPVSPKQEIIEAPVTPQRLAQSQPVYGQLEPNVPAPIAIQVNVDQSRAAHSLGIASLVVGILSFFVCWVPLVGFAFGGLGFVLGAVGLVLAIVRKGSGIGFSIAGTAVSSVALITGAVFMFVVSNTFSAIDEAVSELDTDRTPTWIEPTEPAASTAEQAGASVETEGRQPREWYRAEWESDFEGSRELDIDFDINKGTTYTLTLKLWIRTEPDLPIKELHGHLAFVKDAKTIYEMQLTEKPDVSFTDRCLVWLKIDPYNDDDPAHRTLRYAKDHELTPVFTVSKVVLADGTEKTFD